MSAILHSSAAAAAAAVPASPSSIDDLDLILKGLADPTRLRVLNLLAAGEMCVCDIVELLELPQPTVSRHLAVLRRAGLVVVTRRARFAHYALIQNPESPSYPVLEAVIGAVAGVEQLEGERASAQRCVAARQRRPC